MTELRFEGRTVIVTGAGDGLGLAYVRQLARLGANTVINDVKGADAAAEALRATGARAVAVAGDVSDPATAAQIVAAALDEFGQIDGLINNAGICIRKGLTETSIEDHRRLFEINYYGTLHLTHAVWPVMTAAGYGRIVNVTSTSLYGLEGFSAYAATKGAILGLSRSIALEGAPSGIFVNLLAPGAATAMQRDVGINPETLALMQKTAHPDMVAGVAAWLVHEECRSFGKTYFASGGRAATILFGQTGGVDVGIDHDFTRTPAAMAEAGMHEGFAAEDSVHSALKRR